MAKDANREKGLKNIKYFAKCLIKCLLENDNSCSYRANGVFASYCSIALHLKPVCSTKVHA